MGILRVALAGAALVIGLSMSTVQAAPVGAVNSGIAAQSETLVEKTHSTHRYYARGHRHGYRGRHHSHRRHHYHRRIHRRCSAVRVSCARRHGWGTWRYRRCARYSGC